MSEDFSEFDAPTRSLSDVKAVLTTAATLDPDLDPDDGDFTPDGRYKGFPIITLQAASSVPPQHASLPRRFYVGSPLGAIGLVPWVGSKIIWPWEAGWVQDLHKESVHSLLKEEKKAAKK